MFVFLFLYVRITASLASLIAAGLMYADRGPLGFGRAPEGWKYRYNAIVLSLRFHVGDRPFKIQRD